MVRNIISEHSGTLKRIEWIDIAKGIAILLVIIGHSAKFGSIARNIIFSFHMPLFFILSGYTYRPANDISVLLMHLKKSIKHLLIPCFVVSILKVIVWIYKSRDYSVYNIIINFYKMITNLFYASGVSFNGTVAGMVWFVFSLFWAKLIIDFIYTFQKNDYKYCTIGCLAFLGVCLGVSKYWLFQNFDVTFLAVLYIYIGMIWKKYCNYVDFYSVPLFCTFLSVWSFLIGNGIYIEMASRSYPYYSVCIIESIMASYVFCILCKTCSSINFFKKTMLILGTDSMVLFYIHHCDWDFYYLWKCNNGVATFAMRLTFIFSIYIIYKYIVIYHLHKKEITY